MERPGAINFNDTVSADFASLGLIVDADGLTSDGIVTFSAAIDNTTDSGFGGNFLDSLDVDAGTISIGGTVQATNNIDLTQTTGTLTVGKTVTSTGGNLAFTADDMAITAALTGTSGTLVLAPFTVSKTIGVGGGTGNLDLGDADISNFTDGFSSITIGDAASGTGAVDVDSSTFTDPVAIVGGSIAVTELSSTGNAVTLTARTGSITDGGDVGTDITGSSVVFDSSAAGAVGGSGDAISTAVSNLEADAGGGGVFLSNTGNLIIGGVGGIDGIQATGDIEVTAASDLTVSEGIGNGSPTGIALDASGKISVDADVNTAGAVTISAPTVDVDAEITGASIDGDTDILTVNLEGSGVFAEALALAQDGTTTTFDVSASGATRKALT